MGDSYGIDGHKLDCHLDRVIEWLYTGDTAPVYMEVSPTSRCNHRCQFCALDYAQEGIDIPTGRLLALGEEMAGLGVRGVMFGGEGEPTLHAGIEDVIRHYDGLGLDCAITTNGTGLGEGFAKEGGNRLRWCKVSVNAGDAETYARVHGVSAHAWDRLWRGIMEFTTASPRTTVGVQAVATPDNLHSLPDLCRLASELELDYVVIKPFSPNQYSLKEASQLGVEWGEELASSLLAYQTDVTKIVVRDFAAKAVKEGHTYQRCLSVPYFWAYVNSRQEVIACSNHMLDKRFVLGDLTTQSLTKIWQDGVKRRELRETMKGFDASQCRRACRMDRVNEWLWKISRPGSHRSFI